MDAEPTDVEINETTIALLVSYASYSKSKFIFFKLNLDGKKTYASKLTEGKTIIQPIQNKLAVIKMLDDMLVLGCPTCNDGHGSVRFINIYSDE